MVLKKGLKILTKVNTFNLQLKNKLTFWKSDKGSNNNLKSR